MIDDEVSLFKGYDSDQLALARKYSSPSLVYRCEQATGPDYQPIRFLITSLTLAVLDNLVRQDELEAVLAMLPAEVRIFATDYGLLTGANDNT